VNLNIVELLGELNIQLAAKEGGNILAKEV
jgi:hypothetical protein